MAATTPHFETRFATTSEEVEAAQRLRYDVFVTELGGDGPLVDHDRRLERDIYDPSFRHLLLFDRARAEDDQVVGVYRIMTPDGAQAAGQFYCDDEYDLAPLRTSGRKLLELGRSCVHPDYRGGSALYELWSALADFVLEAEIEILFGVASFHGTDPAALAQPLSFLHHRHLAPEALRVTAKPSGFQRMDLLPREAVDRKTALLQMPSLIKAYLRLGGRVGLGAYIDQDFNTTDICLIMDTEAMNARQRALYIKESAE
ncbi:GNAT family N-acetyltransferase [Aestuariibius insulae]|uniref:GNAT family N-acetyltransferase n=1 Tax=Aestuariibius insulae TaxID=2058287 RepID=UPI00345E5D05